MSVFDRLDQARLKQALVVAGPYAVVEVTDSADSTNAQLLAAPDPPHLSALLAEFQWAGRGRLASGAANAPPRDWVAPRHQAILLSIVVRPPAPSPQLTLVLALAGLDGLDQTLRLASLMDPHLAPSEASPHRPPTGPVAALKWPNDLLLDGHKIGGVLAQGGSDGRVVLGLGLNVHQDSSALPRGAISLRVAGIKANRTDLAANILAAFGNRYQAWLAAPESAAAGAATRLETLGRQVRALLPSGQVITGTATALDPAGRLQIGGVDGQVSWLDAGEVTHLRGG
jgi:BirA family biotin operon repressor/biotin-[acetyl-CoA-carboxylase] ligase